MICNLRSERWPRTTGLPVSWIACQPPGERKPLVGPSVVSTKSGAPGVEQGSAAQFRVWWAVPTAQASQPLGLGRAPMDAPEEIRGFFSSLAADVPIRDRWVCVEPAARCPTCASCGTAPDPALSRRIRGSGSSIRGGETGFQIADLAFPRLKRGTPGPL